MATRTSNGCRWRPSSSEDIIEICTSAVTEASDAVTQSISRATVEIQKILSKIWNTFPQPCEYFMSYMSYVATRAGIASFSWTLLNTVLSAVRYRTPTQSSNAGLTKLNNLIIHIITVCCKQKLLMQSGSREAVEIPNILSKIKEYIFTTTCVLLHFYGIR